MTKEELIEKTKKTIERINYYNKKISYTLTDNEAYGVVEKIEFMNTEDISSLRILYLDSLLILNAKRNFLSTLFKLRNRDGTTHQQFVWSCTHKKTFIEILEAAEKVINDKEKS